eukprot:CAMPEP_0178427272 /NCGR_PEP_ID=MMETSP0689_2-20121128/29660_1 /TAXON_ID=160604 /ORGANISM="Amphidinium massartii, Strain CS-259" /LENGTH=410 /DNA_ID=CAMNT_0020048975 /DNA_START=12 /DNA_END=1244 /DNA_ORIENTATION=+
MLPNGDVMEDKMGSSLAHYSRLSDGNGKTGTCEEKQKPVTWLRIWQVVLGTVIFCLTVSAVPLYSKLVFEGGSQPRFPYPLATAVLQLGFTAIILTIISIVRHLLSPPCPPDQTTAADACQQQPSAPSWCLGPHMMYKISYTAPVGVMFGVKFAVTNWGLLTVPAPTHLLLQSTDLVWTLLFARLVNGERLNKLESVGAWLSSFGAIIISFDASMAAAVPFFPLLVNMLTPIALALTVTFLRKGVKELMNPKNRIGGMTAIEFTAWKISFSAVTALCLSLFLESGTVTLSRHGLLQPDSKPAWWVALQQYPWDGVQLLLVDSFCLLLFQVNLTWLTSLTSAVTVGIIAEIKVIPQWLINSVFGLPVHLTTANIVGSVIMLSASGVYGFSSFNKVVKLVKRCPSSCPGQLP